MNYPVSLSNYDRLFTFGCSFTSYWWPTWADHLGLCFKEYQNWAKQGAGNQFIAESISECDIVNNLNNRDLVVIAFSSHPRFDYYKDGFWKGKGNVLNYHTAEFIEKFYCEKGYIFKSLNMINLSLKYLKLKKVDYILTSMGDLTDLFSNHNLDKSLLRIYPEFSQYYEEIFVKEQFSTPIITYLCRNFSNNEYFIKKSGKKDEHPTPKMHYEWLNSCISNKFIDFTEYEIQSMRSMAYEEDAKLMIYREDYTYQSNGHSNFKRI